jgi:cytochrome b subunit of formate dehydrogenase
MHAIRSWRWTSRTPRCWRTWVSSSALAALLVVAPGRAAATDADCLACHGERDARSDAGVSVFVDAEKRTKSAHAGLSCSDCHSGIEEYPHPSPPPPRAACAACHEDVSEALEQSVHARRNGGEEAPDCRACHGSVHEFPPHANVLSPVAKTNLPKTCGTCHASSEFLARHQLGLARPIEAYALSVHGRALAGGNAQAASCSDCHGTHDIRKAREASSRINRWNVPATCGQCHAQVKEAFEASVHGQAVARGLGGAPVCTDCHGEHAILAPSEAGSLVNPARVSSVTCARCHADERLVERHNLPRDKVPAFQDSFHGLAGRAGSQTVANCASCHGVHNILPSKDPRSSVHTANLAKTCGACHPGAGQRFAIGPVHVTRATPSEHAVARFVRVAYLTLIPATVGFMLLHNGLDFLRKLWRGGPAHASGELVPRMSLHFRVAHGLVVLSFPVLVVTGFALKYPESWWAAPLVALEGKLAFRGSVHRIAAVLLCAACAYHVVHLVLRKRDRRVLRRLLPRARDASDVAAFFRWTLGRRAARPSFGVFSYAEKMEYWAFVWGTAVMAISGFLLWFENWSLSLFPTWVMDAATAIHWYEAILATLAILVWHFYLVIFDPEVYPMDRAWLTGHAAADHLRQRRPVYARLLRRRSGSSDPRLEE